MKIKFHRDARRSKEEVGGIKVPYASAKRAVSQWRWYAILLGVAAPLIILATGLLGRTICITADGQIVLERFEVRAAAPGYVAQLNVDLQSYVSQGAALVRIRNSDMDATETRLRSELKSMSSESHAPLAASHPRDHSAEFALLEKSLAHQRERHRTIAELFRMGAATAAELNEAAAALQNAEAALLERRTAALPLPEAPAPRLGDQRRLIADLAGLQQLRANLVAKAPRGGRVLDVFASQGEFVTAGAPLVLIGSTKAPSIQAYVAPRLASALEAGSLATVRFPDGTRVLATVNQAPALTKRLPADMIEQNGSRPMTVLLDLQSTSDWPSELRIHGLPVRVRFHYAWENNTAGRWVGRALAWLSGYG